MCFLHQRAYVTKLLEKRGDVGFCGVGGDLKLIAKGGDERILTVTAVLEDPPKEASGAVQLHQRRVGNACAARNDDGRACYLAHSKIG